MAAVCSRSGKLPATHTPCIQRDTNGISETMKRILNFPPNTRVEFKSHDSSIQQRTAIDEQRREKAIQHHNDKRNAGSSRQSHD